MTASGFTLARVPPRLGRWLLEADERPGAPPVIVIGHDAWHARFGGDPEIVGKEIRLGTTVHTIVGVMPEGFGFPLNHQYWTPLKVEAAAYDPREGPELYVFGRLAPGVTMEQAQAELTAVGRRAAAAYPETHARIRPMVMPYTHSLTDIQGASLAEFGAMQFTMTLLLLIVAVNVAVLFYARTATRRGEIAVRSALGASRGRVVAQLFIEALVLSLGSAALGLLIAQVGIDLGYGIMETEMGGTPFWADHRLQPTTVAFTVGLAVLTAVLVGRSSTARSARGTDAPTRRGSHWSRRPCRSWSRSIAPSSVTRSMFWATRGCVRATAGCASSRARSRVRGRRMGLRGG